MRVDHKIKTPDIFSDLDDGEVFYFEGEVYIKAWVNNEPFAIALSGEDSGWVNKNITEDTKVAIKEYRLTEVDS